MRAARENHKRPHGAGDAELYGSMPNYENYDWSSVRWFMTGAAPVPVALTQQFQEMGIDITQVYGLTETCGPSASWTR